MHIDTSWHGLFANVGVIAAFIAIRAQLELAADEWRASFKTALTTLLFVCGTVVLMALPFEIRTGVFVDLRSTLIVLSGFLGGPVSGVVTGAAAIALRSHSGGAGLPAGVAGIILTTAIGIAGYYATRKGNARPRDIFVLALVTTLSTSATFFLLPGNMGSTLLREIGPANAVLTFVSTLVAGLGGILEQRRRRSEKDNELYAAVLEALPNPLNVKDLGGRFLAANSATAELMQVPGSATLIGRTDFDFYPPETAERFRADEVKLLEGGKAYSIRQHVVFGNGTDAWLSTTKAPFRDAHGKVIGIITHNRDITERKRLEDQYKISQQQLADALTNMADGLVMFDHDDRIVICNPQYVALFPRTAALRVPGAPLREIMRKAVEWGDEVVPEGCQLEEWIEDTCASLRVEGVREIHMADGRWLQSRVRPSSEGSLTVISDITAAKRTVAELAALNARLDSLANTDGLTGLLNRRAFDEMLTREFGRSARAGEPLSLMLIDVDRFKSYNDTYGHPQGDECLKAVGQCLQASLKRPADSAARYGGEEFVGLLPDTDTEGALVLAEAFRQAVRDLNIPHSGSEKSRVTVTVGIATWAGDHSETQGDLVRRADSALYVGKEGGRDRVAVVRAPERAALRVVGA